MKLSAIKKSVADGAGVTGQTLIYDSAVSTGSNTYLPTGLYGDSIEGTYAFTTNRDKLYLHTGQGWFEVSTINTNPSFITGLSSNYTLASDATAYKNGTATNIEVLATDPEGFDVTYTATGNTAFNNIAHIERTAGHDSAKGRFFTIEPKTQDSAGSAQPADGVLTITASDGINTASTTGTFSLTFDTSVANSENTILLLDGVGNAGGNHSFSDKATTGTTHTVSVTGNTIQGTYSPYSPSGHSADLDGNGDTIKIPGSSDFNLQYDSTFTIEGWFYSRAASSSTDYGSPFLFAYMQNFSWGTTGISYMVYFSAANTIQCDSLLASHNNPHSFSGTYSLEPFKWFHFALVGSGTTKSMYVNGVRVATDTLSSSDWSNSSNISSPSFYIGAANGATATRFFDGYITDFRFVNGTAIYSGESFTVPSRKLTAVSNTKLLVNGPSFAQTKDATRNHVLTVQNGTRDVPWSPYNVSAPYSAATHGGSGHFNGFSNLYTADTTDTNTSGGGAWTVEFWFKSYNLNYSGSGSCIFDFRNSGSGNGIIAELDASGQWWMAAGGTTLLNSFNDTTYGNILVNTWYHIAFVHTGSSFTYYKNGIAVNTTSQTSGANNTGGGFVVGSKQDASYGKKIQGNISDFRFVNGTAVYTGAFTPPSGPLTETGGTYPSNTNIATIGSGHTKFLLNFTDGKIIDKGGRFEFRSRGSGGDGNNVTSTTGVEKFSGTSSIDFPGGGDYLRHYWKQGNDGHEGLYGFHAGEDFTIEGFVYIDASPQGAMFQISDGVLNNTGNDPAFGINSGNQKWRHYASGTSGDASSTASTGQWYHFAYTRNAKTTKLYIDGSEIYTSSNDTQSYTSRDNLILGAYYNTSNDLDGKLSNFRMSKGLSRYPFVPKKETLTTSTSFQNGITLTPSNTKLLTSHAASISDGSATGRTVTASGNAAVSSFAPYGGMKSVYFDGNGDYLSIPTSADFNFGDGDFTIELWIYLTSISGNPALFDYRSTGTENVPSIWINANSGYLYYYFNGANRINGPTSSIVTNKWYHVALSRSSSSTNMFVNGSHYGSTYSDSNTYVQGSTFYIGRYFASTSTNYMPTGYISNFRVVKGQALYTKNFTPTTTALTG